jgi:tetratricopeptide (TPR) repeat protein/transcriptional regulator with XRE-family HTH domain
VAEQPVTLASALRKLRINAELTQEELAEAAGLSPRSISDLERGINQTARKDTARLLADALNLTGSARAAFEAVARGRVVASPDLLSGTTERPGGVAAATRTLPRDIASFTGREPELRAMLDALSGAAGSGGVVGIHAIGGMAGVGKTAFAVHAAHQLATQFPGGQIFLSLHGHTPGQRPVDPADALASLLLTAGVSVQDIPSGLEARIALWRDRMADRKLLLLLDDAASSEQVRPLLPGSNQSLVLVTSRRHLSALEDARAISLDTLPSEVAGTLLVRLAARAGLSTDDALVGEITRLCGYLPLAIGMLARQLHHHPSWTPADLAADLATARDRLELMQAENLSVAAAFNLSYQDLTEAQQRLFRRLGQHPGADIDAYAAAALGETDLTTARRQLGALYDHYLLAEPSRGRYRLHDLIREHAHTLAISDDPDGDREQAVERLLDYYQYTAAAADRQLTRYTRPGRDTAPAAPIQGPSLADMTQALSWARTERANLLACLDHAILAGKHARVSALVAAMASFLRYDGPWAQAVGHHVTAAEAARATGDQLGEANALNDLGVMWYLTGDYPGAAQATETALDMYLDLGNRQGQANALSNLSGLQRLAGDYRGAADKLQAALMISRDLGDMHGQVRALNELGLVRRLSGDYPGASQVVEAALAISRQLGDPRGEAGSLRLLGLVRHLTGDYEAAADVLAAALEISRQLDDRQGQADALFELAVVRRLTGDYAGATDVLRTTLDICRDLGDRGGQANALGVLGSVLRQVGDHVGADDALATALKILRDIGDRGGEAEILNEIGELRRCRRELEQAGTYHRKALELAREIESQWDEAHALAGLGRCSLAAGNRADAEAGLRQALDIFQRIGDAEGSRVSAELEELRSEDSGRAAD